MARPRKPIKNESKEGVTGKVRISCPANNFKRGKRSLRTDNPDLIDQIEKDLTILRDCNILEIELAPADMNSLSKIVWFGNDIEVTTPVFAKSNRDVTKNYDEETFKKLSNYEDLKYRHSRIIEENAAIVQANSKLTTDLLTLQKKYDALSRSLEAQRIAAIESCPDWDECIVLYAKHASETKDLKRYISLVNKFRDRFSHLKTPAEATRNDFIDFLDEYKTSGKKPPKDPAAKWNTGKRNLSPFFKWSSKRYKFTDVFPDSSDNKKEKVREKIFHSKAEINAMLDRLDLRWRAHLSCMCLLGISAHEVRGLPSNALYQEEGQWMIHVRGFKAESRERRLKVPADLLKILQKYEASGFIGKNYFFPAIHGDQEQWTVGTFSKYITGFTRYGKKVEGQKRKTWEVEGQIPKGWSCLSLRKTFASLWLRAKHGRTYVDLAAILGNDPKTAYQWYAEIKGSEVDTEL